MAAAREHPPLFGIADEFISAARSKGWDISSVSPPNGNHVEYGDYTISTDGRQYPRTIIIEPFDRRSNAHEVPSQTVAWVQIRGCAIGEPGRITRGESDLIAYETPLSFWALDRARLAAATKDPKGPAGRDRFELFQPVEGRIYAKGAAMGVVGRDDAYALVELGRLVDHDPSMLVQIFTKK